MQYQASNNHDQGGSASLVHWIVPKTVKANSETGKKKSKFNSKETYSRGKENCNYNYGHRREPSESVSVDSDIKPLVDMHTYKTICTFVEEHLKELKEHEQLIYKARCNLNHSANLQNIQSISQLATQDDITYIARGDTYKLKVRSQQTKAIETIKQLTNYLRELSYLESLYNKQNPAAISANVGTRGSDINPTVDEEIITKLSDLRSEIIQALNNFVLSNSDIEVPIIDCDDINKYDYDLCIDAQTQSAIKKRFSDLSNSEQFSSAELADGSGGSTVNRPKEQYRPNESWRESRDDDKRYLRAYLVNDNLENSIQQQLLAPPQMTKSLSSSTLVNYSQEYLEKRGREIKRLERDTAELRRLYSDFYDLVKYQGEQLDKIEDNIVIATQRISEGQHNLNKSMRGLTIIMPVTGCITGALIGGPLGVVIGGKLGGITIGCVTSMLGLLSSYSVQRCLGINKIKND